MPNASVDRGARIGFALALGGPFWFPFIASVTLCNGNASVRDLILAPFLDASVRPTLASL